jgi:hypothetical protein
LALNRQRAPDFGVLLVVCTMSAGCAFGSGLSSVAEVEPQPRAASPGGLTIVVTKVAFGDEVERAQPTVGSRIVVLLECRNRGSVARSVDVGDARLGVSTSPTEPMIFLPALGSGWGAPTGNLESRLALATTIPPGGQKRAWIVFAAPAPRTEDGRLGLTLVIDSAPDSFPLTLADPERAEPRWILPQSHSPYLLTDTGFVGPRATVGDGLLVRYVFPAGSSQIDFGFGLSVLHHAQSVETGSETSLTLTLGRGSFSRVGLLPFLGGEVVGYSPTLLFGALAGLELAIGHSTPTSPFPITYRPAVPRFAIRAAYVRWFGWVDSVSTGAAGASGALLSASVSFPP